MEPLDQGFIEERTMLDELANCYSRFAQYLRHSVYDI